MQTRERAHCARFVFPFLKEKDECYTTNNPKKKKITNKHNDSNEMLTWILPCHRIVSLPQTNKFAGIHPPDRGANPERPTRATWLSLVPRESGDSRPDGPVLACSVWRLAS